MAVKTSLARTSAAELETMMQYPSEARIRAYAEELFGDADRAQHWLTGDVPSLDQQVPEVLLRSSNPEDLRRVLTVLVQIDYGVIA